MNPLLLVDSYKLHHNRQYPEGMTKLYSNFTPRKSRIKGIDNVVVFGIQHFVKEYLTKRFNDEFFNKDIEKILEEYERHCPVNTDHIAGLWNLGYLPIEIKALEEGTLCPIGVPMLTITNTHPDFGWLVNYLETLLSCMLWQPITSATLAYQFRKLLNGYAIETTGSTEGVQWQGHDFSMRGMSSPESAILSGMGHLLSFTGTDTIPAIYTLESSYGATGLVGASVPATEHSVMCMGTKESEVDTFKRLLNLYPTDTLSVVSDTWDLWKVLTKYLPQLKEEILARDGKLVIRPDSGDPVDIICGKKIFNHGGVPSVEFEVSHFPGLKTLPISDKSLNQNEIKGVIELLWDVFGGTTNEQGYKVLDSHIGAIYGDSINLERAEQICERLKAKGFASTNIVLGIGSYTYQYNTRDTFGFAMKATYGEVIEEIQEFTAGEDFPHMEKKSIGREIFKDPITDDGTKKSKKGLLQVFNNRLDTAGDTQLFDGKDQLKINDQITWEQEKGGLLQTVFRDSKLVKETTLDQIRERLNK